MRYRLTVDCDDEWLDSIVYEILRAAQAKVEKGRIEFPTVQHSEAARERLRRALRMQSI